MLLGTAIPDDGALHFGGCVLDDRAARFDCGENGHAARMSQLQRAACVDGVEQRFDSDAVRLARCEERGKLPMNSGEALRERITGERRDGPAGDKMMSTAVRLHATVAGALGAGIDAED